MRQNLWSMRSLHDLLARPVPDDLPAEATDEELLAWSAALLRDDRRPHRPRRTEPLRARPVPTLAPAAP